MISVLTTAQDLSGINILNFGLQKRDVELMAGGLSLTGTDEEYKMFIKFATVYRASPNATLTTVLVADTVSAQGVYELYIKAANDPAYVAVGSGERVTTAIKAVVNTPLQNAISAYDQTLTQSFLSRRAFGRFRLTGRKD